MKSLWTETLRLYIRHTISPDGRDTFESTPQLAKALQRVASRPSSDTLLDFGCGWGASLNDATHENPPTFSKINHT